MNGDRSVRILKIWRPICSTKWIIEYFCLKQIAFLSKCLYYKQENI